MSGLTEREIKLRENAEKYQAEWAVLREQQFSANLDWSITINIARQAAKAILVDWATAVADEYWANLRNAERRKEFWAYRVRVIENDWSVSAVWHKVEGRGARLKPKTTDVALPKDRTRMSMTQFKKATPEEQYSIALAELEFDKIRRCNLHLKAITRACLGINNILNAKLQALLDAEQEERDEEFRSMSLSYDLGLEIEELKNKW